VGSDSAAFTFYSSDEGSVFECSLDGTPYAAGASPESCANLSSSTETRSSAAASGVYEEYKGHHARR
jgi:hypothetical protein